MVTKYLTDKQLTDLEKIIRKEVAKMRDGMISFDYAVQLIDKYKEKKAKDK